MKRTWTLLPLAALAATACSTPKAIESTAAAERRDTLRAVLAEELTVRLDDVVILPPDTLHPRIVAARVELRRDREATLSRRIAESEQTTVTKTPAPRPEPWRPPLWVALAAGVGAYIAGAWRRN